MGRRSSVEFHSACISDAEGHSSVPCPVDGSPAGWQSHSNLEVIDESNARKRLIVLITEQIKINTSQSEGEVVVLKGAVVIAL